MQKFKKAIPYLLLAIFALGVSFIQGDYKPSVIPNEKRTKVTFLDVGQGDSALIQTKSGKTILVDSGPDNIISERLSKELGPFQKQIDYVILTHPHADHIAGLNTLFDRYTFNQIYMSEFTHTSPDYLELLNNIKNYQVTTEKVTQGKELIFEEIKIRFLWPPANYLGNTKDLNDTSIAFSLEVSGSKTLFLGDLPEDMQEKMLENEQLSKIEIVKIAHHGANDGISSNLIQVTEPNYAIISVGAGNSFGHPTNTTLEKLQTIKVFRTDKDGTVIFYHDGTNFIKS